MSCSAPRSCGSSSIRRRSATSSRRSARGRGTRTSCTTCCGEPGRCRGRRPMRASPRPSSASVVRSAPGSAGGASCWWRPRTPASSGTRSAPSLRAACPRPSWSRCRTHASGCCSDTRAPPDRSRLRKRPCGSGSSRRRRARCSPGSSRVTCSCGASCARVGRSASGAIRMCSAGCAAPRWRACAARSSPQHRLPSGASCPPGTGSTAGRACARRSCRCRRCPSRSRCGRARCCRGASPATSPRGSISSARPARSSGSAPGSTAWRSSSATTLRCWGPRAVARRRRATPSWRCVPRCSGARSSSPICSSRLGWKPSRRCRRCGSSSGPARSRTTPGRRSVPGAAMGSRSRSAARAASRGRAGRSRSLRLAAGRRPLGCSGQVVKEHKS